jgi:hypothetical protein
MQWTAGCWQCQNPGGWATTPIRSVLPLGLDSVEYLLDEMIDRQGLASGVGLLVTVVLAKTGHRS